MAQSHIHACVPYTQGHYISWELQFQVHQFNHYLVVTWPPFLILQKVAKRQPNND